MHLNFGKRTLIKPKPKLKEENIRANKSTKGKLLFECPHYSNLSTNNNKIGRP